MLNQKYESVWDIPTEVFPCYLHAQDAQKVVRLCEYCHNHFVGMFSENEAKLVEGEICVGCGHRSQGVMQDALNEATGSLMEAVLAGATEHELRQVLKEARWFAQREQWKQEGERKITNPSHM